MVDMDPKSHRPDPAEILAQAEKVKKLFRYLKRGIVILSPLWLGLTIFYLVTAKSLSWPFILLIIATYFGYKWLKQHKAEKAKKKASNVIDVKAKEVDDGEEKIHEEKGPEENLVESEKPGQGL